MRFRRSSSISGAGGAKQLETLLTEGEQGRQAPSSSIEQGAPAGNTGLRASRGDIDLIVMATHGRGGVARLMMGSVADKVVRAAPCPVLTLSQSGESAAQASHAA